MSRDEPGPPRLLVASGEPFALWWSGDPQLDAVLDCRDAPEAATALVGADRATRPVTRSLARSIVGRADPVGHVANANLYPMSVVLGLDAPVGDPGRLAPDDVAAVLAAGTGPTAPTRRAQLGVFAREALQRLLVGYSRRRRRDLGIELLTDQTGDADAFLRLLDEAADLAYLEAFPTPTARLAGLVEHLRYVLAHYRVPSRRMPLAGARSWRGRTPIELPEGLAVRVPWSRELLEAEAMAFGNCLGSYYGRIELAGVLIATVWQDERPLAAAEISPSGRLRLMLGVDDAEVDLADRRTSVDALRRAGVLRTPSEPAELTVPERIEGRIACRAALLLAEEVEPEADALELSWAGYQHGDRTLELLGRHEALLTDDEYELLRDGHTPDPIDGWSYVGAMLVAAGARDPALAELDGRAPFRRAARTMALQILYGAHRLPAPHEVADLRLLLLGDSGVPPWQRDAVAEVCAQCGR